MSSTVYIDPTKPHFPITSGDPRASQDDPLRELRILEGDSMFEALGVVQGWAGSVKSAQTIGAEFSPAVVKVTIG